jgi:hypothetical protein
MNGCVAPAYARKRVGVSGPTNVTLDGLRRVSMNLRDETSSLEAAPKPVGVLQAASRWSVTGYVLGEPARAVNTPVRANSEPTPAILV